MTARAGGHYGAGYQLLSGTALPPDNHGGGAIGDAADGAVHIPHGFAGADELAKRRFAARFILQLPPLDFLLTLLERLLQLELQLPAIHRRDEDFIGARGVHTEPLLARADAGDGVQHNIWVKGAEGAQNLATIGRLRRERIDVEYDRIQRSFLMQGNNLFRGVEKRNVEEGG